MTASLSFFPLLSLKCELHAEFRLFQINPSPQLSTYWNYATNASVALFQECWKSSFLNCDFQKSSFFILNNTYNEDFIWKKTNTAFKTKWPDCTIDMPLNLASNIWPKKSCLFFLSKIFELVIIEKLYFTCSPLHMTTKKRNEMKNMTCIVRSIRTYIHSFSVITNKF